MANVRLLRQLVQDYQNRFNAVNEGYQDKRSIYEKAVAGYNSAVERTRAGEEHLWKVEGQSTNYAIFSGVNEDTGGLMFKSKANVVDAPPQDVSGAIVDSEGNPATTPLNNVWVRGDNGIATLYTIAQTGTEKKTVPGYEGDTREIEVPVFQYVPSQRTVALAPDEPPVAPDRGKYPRDPFTEKEKGILSNPPATQSEMNLANAKGAYPQSALAGDQPASPTSAFANPEDPNNLKEKGVLARVLGGQL